MNLRNSAHCFSPDVQSKEKKEFYKGSINSNKVAEVFSLSFILPITFVAHLQHFVAITPHYRFSNT